MIKCLPIFFIVLIFAAIVTAGFAIITFAVIKDQRDVARHSARWEGAIVVKVCPSNVVIYRLKTGEIVTPSESPVADLQTVC